jgi:hypothetical protein
MIFAGDLIVKTAIELGIEDLKKNDWLIDDILSDVVEIPELAKKYGIKEINSCKSWLAAANISVTMKDRPGDKDEFPCVCISLGSSNECEEDKRMGDLTAEVVDLIPSKIGKPIPYILKPFTPASYDVDAGLIELPAEIDAGQVAEGMILINPESGAGAVIRGLGGENGIEIDEGIDLKASKLAVVPKYQIYRARREGSFFRETYNIGCHVSGDPSQLLWLHAIVAYSLLRYREGLLEARGFIETLINSSDMVPNNSWGQPGGDNVYSRYITLSGKVENTWLKTPRRVIESVKLADSTEEGFTGGIKILSDEAPEEIKQADNLWITIDDGE